MRAFEAIQLTAVAPGPRLIVTGAVHGNETCGTAAIRRVLQDIEQQRLAIVAGHVTFVPVANPLAYERGERQGDRNLNRKLSPTGDPQEFEDHVANWLCPLLAGHDVLLDLHSFHTAGEPFVMVGPEDNQGTLEPFGHAALEEALAVRLGVRRIVDGWLGTYAGGVERRRARLSHAGGAALDLDADYGVGTTEYMRRVGGWGFTLECGQHEDSQAPEVAYRAILNTLAHLRLIDAPAPSPAAAVEALRLFEVVDKAHDDDRFSRSWTSFDAVRAGELIGVRHDGTAVHAEADGRIVFPNPGAQAGQEWFYLARPHRRFG
ncbi:succinylglutamate desuccinylase/aspartoacylase family protein [Piscinibacter sp. XHJ-5]|uniref:succinylglutamate desuccinylase/aspartoacylase domain-containing protein n=1 Tax=Piscinibacter sp. XHJ-5 TaxID=3037797 RepID=UPI0024529C5A|nr:succinylglutamate desuccinylase/aspartoacylase family protein [Piscinibacter sp. XHJ-5]